MLHDPAAPARFRPGCPKALSRTRVCRTFAATIRPARKNPHVANIKSQLKRIKTNEKRTERNKAVKSELRTWVRKFREAVSTGDKDASAEALKAASAKLDKAVSKGVIHANQAANKKSSMAKKHAAL